MDAKKGKRIDDATRSEIVRLHAEGHSYSDISQRTRVSKMGCFKIVRDYITTGTVEKKLKSTPLPTKLTVNVLQFIEYQKVKKPSTYAREIRTELLKHGVCTEDNLPSVTLINRAIKRDLDMTRKIVQSIPKESLTDANDNKIQMFLAAAMQYRPEQLHFFDEASVVQTSGNRKYGHSPVGEPAIEIQRYASSCTLTVNVCCGYFGLDYFDVIEGASNAMEMVNFFDNVLQQTNSLGNPCLARGDCVILDNCGFHHHRFWEQILRNMLAQHGISLLFLPPYRPELNVVEYIFRLMRYKLQEDSLLTYGFTEFAVVNSLTLIPDFFLPSLFQKCGYI
jgi:hypothetical protein